MVLDREILSEFQTESQMILGELIAVVDSLENSSSFEARLYSEFAQKIDRIMGGAETLVLLEPEHAGLKTMAELARLCKRIGYNVAENKRVDLSAIVSGFLSDVVEVFQTLLRNIDDLENSRKIAEGFGATLKKRLQLVADQLK